MVSQMIGNINTLGDVDVGRIGVYYVRDVDPNTSTWRWCIDNFSQVPNRTYSDHFEFGSYPWRLFIFPQGNHVPSLSLYLDVGDANTAPRPPTWSRFAKFRLSVLNQIDITKSVMQDAEKRYCSSELDWGFRELIPLAKLNDESEGFKINDRVILEVTIRTYQQPHLLDLHYDSKQYTGFIPTVNSHKGSYMGSLLQIVYHITAYRRFEYQNNAKLSHTFWKLQFENDYVSTKLGSVSSLDRLIEDFTSFFTNDERLAMVQGTLKGHIKCCDVDYESTSDTPFTVIDIPRKFRFRYN
jgi:hypothetical protein